jgi:hypothetical protein
LLDLESHFILRDSFADSLDDVSVGRNSEVVTQGNKAFVYLRIQADRSDMLIGAHYYLRRYDFKPEYGSWWDSSQGAEYQ